MKPFGKHLMMETLFKDMKLSKGADMTDFVSEKRSATENSAFSKDKMWIKVK
jgi:hypothetical protein